MIPMDRKQKAKVIKTHGKKDGDTGSAVVQVAIFTKRIEHLTDHLKKHPKDKHSRRGLLGLVGKRRKALNYLKYHKKPEYDEITEKLALKR